MRPNSQLEAKTYDHRFLGISLILLASFSFATQDALVKKLSYSLPVLQVMLIQLSSLFVYAVVWILWQNRCRLSAVRINHPRLQLLRGLFFTSEALLFYFIIKRIQLADLHAIFSISPIIVMVLSLLILKEQIKKASWLAVAVGFIGVLVIVRPGIIPLAMPTLLALCAATLWSIYLVLNRLLGGRDSIAVSLMCLSAIAVITAAALVIPHLWVWPTIVTWGQLLLLCAVNASSFSLQLYAYRFAPANLLQPFSYTVFLWAVFWGYYIFGDLPDSYTITGAALIIGSGLAMLYLEQLSRRKKRNVAR